MLNLEYAKVILTTVATATPINMNFLVKIERTFFPTTLFCWRKISRPIGVTVLGHMEDLCHIYLIPSAHHAPPRPHQKKERSCSDFSCSERYLS